MLAAASHSRAAPSSYRIAVAPQAPTKLSNPYLSQIERGLHQPSVRVIRLISDALNVSTETLLAQAGLFHRDSAATAETESPTPDIEAAIQAEPRLSEDQKNALIAVLRSMLPTE